MKTFDKVIATSKAVLGLTLFVTVALIVGYANAQLFDPLNPYVNPYDEQIRMMERQNDYSRVQRQEDRQRQRYDYRTSPPSI